MDRISEHVYKPHGYDVNYSGFTNRHACASTPAYIWHAPLARKLDRFGNEQHIWNMESPIRSDTHMDYIDRWDASGFPIYKSEASGMDPVTTEQEVDHLRASEGTSVSISSSSEVAGAFKGAPIQMVQVDNPSYTGRQQENQFDNIGPHMGGDVIGGSPCGVPITSTKPVPGLMRAEGASSLNLNMNNNSDNKTSITMTTEPPSYSSCTHPYTYYPEYTINVQNSKDIIKPGIYDGSTPFSDYKIQFEIISEHNEWDRNTMAGQLAGKLRGEANGILSNLKLEDRLDYGKLIQALNDRFEPDNLSTVFRKILNHHTRAQNESLPKFAQDIRTLFRKAYPHRAHDEQDLVRYFIDGIMSNSKMTWYVHSSNPDTLSAAVNLAMEYEAFVCTS